MADPLGDIRAILADRLKRGMRRQIGSAVLFGIALLLLGVAIVAGIVAIGVALAAHWGVIGACLIIAGVALGLAAVLVGVVGAMARTARRRQRAQMAQWQQSLLAAKAIVPGLSTGKALLIATALGVLVGLTTKPKDNS